MPSFPNPRPRQLLYPPGQDHESESNNHSMENLRESCSYQHGGRYQSGIDDAHINNNINIIT